ncbi:MAG: RnfABCDGE type electron transport complex subunit D [Planctomycetota bacterium]
MIGRTHRFQLQAAPFLHTSLTTPKLMVEVTLTLVPVIAAAAYYFGVVALLLIAASTLGAVAAEYLLPTRAPRGSTLRDGSGVLTGVLVGLTLPPPLPLWMAALGGFVAIALGKQLFGGLGQNLFNPALVGRAFLQAAFPTALTTWVEPRGFFDVPNSTWAWPFLHGALDGTSAPTPLSRVKFDHALTPFQDLFLGHVPGSLGETSALVLVLCGLWLGLRRAFDWRIPCAVLLGVAALSSLLHLLDPTRNPTPWFMLASGGLLFGTVFMATDPVSSPTTPRGAWIFGLGVGVLVVVIRDYGGLPEGVMYAILLMNAATPLIERVAQPRPFGRARRA